MRSLALLVVLVGCSGTWEEQPGELLAEGVVGRIDNLIVRGDTLAWTSASDDEERHAFYATQLDGSVFMDAVPALGAGDAVAVAGDDIFVAGDGGIFRLDAERELAQVVRTTELVDQLHARHENGRTTLVFSIGTTVYWVDTALHQLDIGLHSRQLVATDGAIFVRTGPDVLRIDRAAQTVHTAARASAFENSFPPDLVVEKYRACQGYTIQELRVVGDRVLALVFEQNCLGDMSRGLVVSLGDATVLVDTMWEPATFWVDGDKLLWHERTSDPVHHRPTDPGESALWSAPLGGGTPVQHLPTHAPLAIDGGFAYGVYYVEGQSIGVLRRVPI